ncbi:CsbD family protein [Streptococcus salivarius]|uniref:CsbD family protein n=1 Tax=Streptococcus salivarius TaxID=1304 RepID=UPI001C030958|nr:CsbD family protein [Streptococcus salivarius]MBT9628826.1 CsbD family protein [Streptococcus salivarius]
MGIEDKLNQAKGALKEGAGKLSGDKKTQAEGAVEKVVAKAKDGLEDVKEGIEGAVEGLKNSFKK